MISLINNFSVFFLFPADFDYQRNTDNETFDFKAYFRFLGPSFSPFYIDFASKTMVQHYLKDLLFLEYIFPNKK